jgi:hypothetical protein
MVSLMMKSPGNLISKALAGVWRESLSADEMTPQELAVIAPALLKAEGGPLGWWRIRNSSLRSLPIALELQQSYRYYALQAAIHECGISEAIRVFRSAGIEPVLIKGWAIARLYPDQALRLYSDVDLCVHPEQYSAADEVLRSPEARGLAVDLHNGVERFHDLNFDDILKRTQLVPLGDTQVRILSPEDHLRVLSLHLLHHGAWRPLWLCDIAIAVETRPSDFDWDRCLGSDARTADWVACAIGLAHQLLGARVDDTPVALRAFQLPGWLMKQVLKQWEAPISAARGTLKHRAPMISYLRNPANALRDLHTRWPGAIEATMSVGGPFNKLPRWPFQLANCLQRTAGFAKQLPRSLRGGARDLDSDSASRSKVLIESID